MSTALSLYIVDAFTDVSFAGNQAAVCLIPYEVDIDDATQQNIATEMNLAVTAFVKPLSPTDTFRTADRFSLRWFTPKNEAPLCGHATLASGATLFHCQDNCSNIIFFETMSGELSVTREEDSISMNFPKNTPERQDDLEEYHELLQTANVSNILNEVWYDPLTRNLMVRLKDSVARENFETLDVPGHLLMEKHNAGKVMGVILTVKASDGSMYDFFSRYFAQWKGIPEDHVTGSAHTVLAAYWSTILNKSELYAHQCSKRGGDLKLKVLPNDRVLIEGKSTFIVKGNLYI